MIWFIFTLLLLCSFSHWSLTYSWQWHLYNSCHFCIRFVIVLRFLVGSLFWPTACWSCCLPKLTTLYFRIRGKFWTSSYVILKRFNHVSVENLSVESIESQLWTSFHVLCLFNEASLCPMYMLMLSLVFISFLRWDMLIVFLKKKVSFIFFTFWMKWLAYF